MGMIRGTTPDYVLTLPGIDLTGMTVYVTIRQKNREITLTGAELTVASDGEDSTIAFMLTQKQTLMLNEGQASVQVKFIDASGTVGATKIGRLTIDKALLEKVIEYDGELSAYSGL